MSSSSYSFLLLLASLMTTISRAKIPCAYHQVHEYRFRDEFRARTCSSSQQGTCTVSPFVSPNNSLDAHLHMIQEATSSIIIANPNFESWNRECTKHHSDCYKSECTGCSIEQTRKENFTVFVALLEAMQNRKVSVKILTNDYNVSTCPGQTTLLDYLFLNGAELRMYRTTVFMHAKFISIDNGKKILISSVNFSQHSFKLNRETGVILSDCDCSELDLYESVFNYDWNEGYGYTPTSKYTKEQMQLITTPISNSSTSRTIKSLEKFENTKIVRMYVGPDYARDTFFEYFNGTKQSLLAYIYTIDDMAICDSVISLDQKGVRVSLMISNRTLYNSGEKCYEKLNSSGINIKKYSNNKRFTFEHQKYWIIDDTDVHLSTGNWNPSDFINGYDDKPIPVNKYPIYANRDMLIVMRNPELVKYFKDLFTEDGGTIV